MVNTKKIIFCHSLFRAGSTYFFKLLSDKNDHFVIEEPLNEIVIRSNGDVEKLNEKISKNELRHDFHHSYFENYEKIPKNFFGLVKEDFIYKSFFNQSINHKSYNFLKKIVDLTKSRIFISETRLACRLKPLSRVFKDNIYQISLLRNPRDQWWSYNVNTFFNLTNIQIIQGNNIPLTLKEIIKKNKLKKNLKTLDELYDFFRLNPVSVDISYEIFFTIWCYCFNNWKENSNLIIDTYDLTISNKIIRKYEGILKKNDIYVDFSKFNIPIYNFNPNERVFFQKIESSVIERLVKNNEIKFIKEIKKYLLKCSKSVLTINSNESSARQNYIQLHKEYRNVTQILNKDRQILNKDRDLLRKQLSKQNEELSKDIVKLQNHCNDLKKIIFSTRFFRILKTLKIIKKLN